MGESDDEPPTKEDIVNETTDVSRCEGKANCHQGQQCLTHNLWIDLSARINSFLDEITLGELIRQNQAQGLALNSANSLNKIELTTID